MMMNLYTEEKKIVAAVEIDGKGGVKRAYFKRIDDYSSGELGKIFQSHISTQANVKTDKWTGCKPLKNEYNIEQIKSNTSDFFEMNTIIHQVKSWLRSIYSWMHEQNIERHLDEYSYRLNRSIHKQSIFDNLIIRMINHKTLDYKELKQVHNFTTLFNYMKSRSYLDIRKMFVWVVNMLIMYLKSFKMF